MALPQRPAPSLGSDPTSLKALLPYTETATTRPRKILSVPLEPVHGTITIPVPHQHLLSFQSPYFSPSNCSLEDPHSACLPPGNDLPPPFPRTIWPLRPVATRCSFFFQKHRPEISYCPLGLLRVHASLAERTNHEFYGRSAIDIDASEVV